MVKPGVDAGMQLHFVPWIKERRCSWTNFSSLALVQVKVKPLVARASGS